MQIIIISLVYIKFIKLHISLMEVVSIPCIVSDERDKYFLDTNGDLSQSPSQVNTAL